MTTRTHRSLRAWQLWCTRAHCGCLWRKRGSPGNSSAIARGGGVTDAVEQRGVAAATMTWAPVKASSCVRETLNKAGNGCGSGLWGSQPLLQGEGGWGDDVIDETRPVTSGVLQCFRFREKRERGNAPFRKGKGADEAALGSHTEGWPEDAIATDNQSQTASGLTRGGRQPVRLVRPKDLLSKILLWDQTYYLNRMGWKKDVLESKENCEEKFKFSQFK
jgi:hypothetical protein